VQGYWNKPQASAETSSTLAAYGRPRADRRRRLLYIVDRKKDMINRGARTSTRSRSRTRSPRRRASRGRRRRRARRDDGGEGRAAIVPAAGVTLDVAAVIAHCRERLADFKVPQYVAVRPSRCHATPAARCSRRNCATRSTGASRCASHANGGGAEMSQVQTVQVLSRRAELGLTLVHEHLRFRDEAVAVQWPNATTSSSSSTPRSWP